MNTGAWFVICVVLAVLLGMMIENGRQRGQSKPVSTVNVKVAEQTDRLIDILEKKCLPQDGFPEDGEQRYNLN